jgi:glycosyltransferase involved in cell wall biosynthesis
MLPNTINKYIDKFCVKHADLILTNSDYEREYIWRTYGLFPITNRLGVDPNKFRRLDLDKEYFIVSVGVIVPVKAHDFVIRSVALIPGDKRPKVVVVGSSGDKRYIKELKKLAKDREVKLEIKINVSDEEIVRLYNKARVTAIAYVMEPSIEPESLGCETPIVAVREAGARETIINGETGILTNRHEEKFAEAIEYILDHPDVAAKMGRKGREWIEKNFTWDKCAENLERNFERVLNRKI